jgi:hypothetical protein
MAGEVLSRAEATVMALTPAERKANQRARAVAAGKCIMCAKRKARAGKTKCKRCNDDTKRRIKEARAEA